MFASAVEKRQPTNSRKDSGNTGFPRKAFTQKYGSECFRLFDTDYHDDSGYLERDVL